MSIILEDYQSQHFKFFDSQTNFGCDRHFPSSLKPEQTIFEAKFGLAHEDAAVQDDDLISHHKYKVATPLRIMGTEGSFAIQCENIETVEELRSKELLLKFIR